MFAGQCGFGGSQSLTVTRNWQVSETPVPSAAVQVTVVAPFEYVEPDAGLHTIDTGGHVPVAVGVKLTTASHRPLVVQVVMSSGQSTNTVQPPLQLVSS